MRLLQSNFEKCHQLYLFIFVLIVFILFLFKLLFYSFLLISLCTAVLPVNFSQGGSIRGGGNDKWATGRWALRRGHSLCKWDAHSTSSWGGPPILIIG